MWPLTAVLWKLGHCLFDAAKHVELPTEVFDNKTSNYWNTILNNGSQFQYGEVLQGDSGLDYKAYADLFANNSSDGGGNTASNYGKSVRAAISSGNLSTKMVQNIDTGGAKEDQLVTWVAASPAHYCDWRVTSRHCMTASTPHCIRAGIHPCAPRRPLPRRRYAWT